MPYKHPKEPYFNDGNIRFVPKWSYKIIYLIGDVDITILSVFNTSQNSIKSVDDCDNWLKKYAFHIMI